MRLVERAPAKVNLTLHVNGRREDSFHELESLVAFTCFGDLLTLDDAALLSLDVSGPRAAGAGPVDDNLVLRAARAFAGRWPQGQGGQSGQGGAFRLAKTLPAAAGIGGGSSDAAAALRLLARAHGVSLDSVALQEIAGSIGSDVPVCLGARARMMFGRGESLGAPLRLPPLFAVLVNPGVAVETGEVFARMGLKPGESSGSRRHPDIASGLSFQDLLALLKRARNDMEDAASVMAPVIGHVLAVLSAARGCRLARMSGSGATCFALFETRRAASRAAAVIRRDHPGWWVRASVLR